MPTQQTPGGSTSNFYSYFTRGDVALSVCMTMASTLCAFFMMPILLYIYGTQALGISVDQIPLRDLFQQLALVLVPVFLGITIRAYTNPIIAYRVTSIGSFSGFVVIFAVIGLGLADPGNQFYLLYSGADVWFTTNAIGIIGCVLGYVVSTFVGERPRQARTISYETGIQNGLVHHGSMPDLLTNCFRRRYSSSTTFLLLLHACLPSPSHFFVPILRLDRPLSIAIAAVSFPKPCYKGSSVGSVGDIDAAVIPLLYSLFISVQSPFICLFFRYVLVSLSDGDGFFPLVFSVPTFLSH